MRQKPFHSGWGAFAPPLIPALTPNDPRLILAQSMGAEEKKFARRWAHRGREILNPIAERRIFLWKKK
jgi:hypothetical protein